MPGDRRTPDHAEDQVAFTPGLRHRVQAVIIAYEAGLAGSAARPSRQ